MLKSTPKRRHGGGGKFISLHTEQFLGVDIFSTNI
jgi:hypothetical protein